MLKALELVGFKSFADKTRFEFPRGITAVVGPNGSGKSNVVDAIKWVLGEQSVKSLRGKEMVDVIFNGSATRHPLNAAEATLAFENSERRLEIDTPEVLITRRVYRSGEAEYLINRQPCRLRDIRDLFSGTGAATEAYSVIEQGKVDVMLQSSAKDRRALFEEAAGISRFKAKKIETLRRLERVDQNLLRLSDIVDEVGNRLRSVRLQATKARRYKEYADRLQQLRTQVAGADWRRLGERLAALEAELAELAAARDVALAEAEQLEAQALAIDAQLDATLAAQRACEARSAENRERIAAREASVEEQRGQMHESEAEETRLLRQLTAMRVRAGDLEQQLAENAAAVADAHRQHNERLDALSAAEHELARLADEHEQLRAEYESSRSASLEALRTVAALETEATSLVVGRDSAQAALEQRTAQRGEVEAARKQAQAEVERLALVLSELSAAAEAKQTELSAAQERLIESQAQLKADALKLAQLRERHSAAAERASLLQELETRQEGLNAGAKEVLAMIRGQQDGPLRAVRGMLADLLHVPVEMAPAVEAALGDKIQAFVVEPDAAFSQWAESQSSRLPGRITFVPIAAGSKVAPALRDGGAVAKGDRDLRHGVSELPWDGESVAKGDRDLRHGVSELPWDGESVAKGDRDLRHGVSELPWEALPGVHGRADRFVEAPAELAALLWRLLGNTWIVENLATALELVSGDGAGSNFVTLNGEWVGADGTIAIGPRQAAAGIISRRSELRVLKQQTAELAAAVAAAQSQVEALERRIAEETAREAELSQARQQAAEVLGEHRLRSNAADSLQAQLAEQLARLAAECAEQERNANTAAQSLETTREKLGEAKARLSELEKVSQAVRQRVRQADERSQQAQRQATTAKVEVAKSEERLASLDTQLAQLQRDQRERRRSVDECRQQLSRARRRRRQAEGVVLGAESDLAESFLRREMLAAEAGELAGRHESQRVTRGELQAAAQGSQAQARALEQQRHARDLAANEVRHERTTLAARLKEDYQIELAELSADLSLDEQRERDEVDQEIAELRRKINHIGMVNLDALAELEELEARHAALSGQFNDLSKAKDSLVQIIGKINADTRRLFVETLQTVTTNFQALFRKLFGGGQADVVLEEGVDVLDSGIEIVARPPGKELRNISLLSGGEKTLTCVALLLAIFQYRPSPFCVLDEVDAALDEANIERFIGVLQEFLAWTQFIVITHSKKTMTCASTLYGVTMEESGVSKRVSVRFEDVSDDGQIQPSERIRESA